MSIAMPVAAPMSSCFAAPRGNAAPLNECDDSLHAFGVDRARLHHTASPAANDRFSHSPASTPSSNSAASASTVMPDGRLRDELVPANDRHTAVAMHLSPIAFIWIGPFALAIPLVLWLMRKDHSRFADDHGRETVNFSISFIVLHFLLAITIIGLLAIPVLWIVACVGVIRGALAAGRNEFFRYPMTIRFL